MKMYANPQDLPDTHTENGSATTSSDQHQPKEGFDHFFQELGNAIDAADQNDSSLWRMWR